MIRTLKLDQLLKFTYEHVDAHQERHLTLEEQINVKCDELMIQEAPENLGKQLLPLERATVFENDFKLTTDVAKEVHFYLGEVEAQKFYKGRVQKKGRGLGWSATRFA